MRWWLLASLVLLGCDARSIPEMDSCVRNCGGDKVADCKKSCLKSCEKACEGSAEDIVKRCHADCQKQIEALSPGH